MPQISRLDSPVPCLPSLEGNPLHVIFYRNKVFVTKHFDKVGYQRAPPCTIVFRPRLKEFLKRCASQFHVYIWFTIQHHNIYNYLDQIQHETQIFINLSRVFDKKFYMQNPHFLNQINLISQFPIKIFMFSFLRIVTLTLAEPCL